MTDTSKQTEKQHKAEARVVKGDDELATYNDRFRTANRKFDAIVSHPNVLY